MPLGRKKVIIRRLAQDWVAGYVGTADFAGNDAVELLELAGKVLHFPFSEVKWVCFVRDFNSGEAGNPERLLRKTFGARPRSEGLWLRLKLIDGDSIEGLGANDLSLRQSSGLFLTPPDIRSNTQRLFIPHRSIAALEVVAVISGPSRRKPPEAARQEELFGGSE
jgi:hypothetical protein